MNDLDKLLEVRGLKKYYPIDRGLFSEKTGYVKAVDDVSFTLAHGETLGLVGESGCGKTTAGKSILRLLDPTGGEVIFEGRDITKIPGRELRAVRRRMQFIFQDPYASLNPRMTVGETIEEAYVIHGISSKAGRRDMAEKLLDRVGLPKSCIDRHPHEFSGGQRQRVGIARALALSPALVVCDEPVSALDVSIQSQILNLLKELQSDLGLTYIFISHGLAAVKYISDRIAVMYLGRIVETAATDEIFENTLHPYTESLLSAIPIPDPKVKRERIILRGDIPNPMSPPSGCHFHTRCPHAREKCATTEPEWRNPTGNHGFACHYPLK